MVEPWHLSVVSEAVRWTLLSGNVSTVPPRLITEYFPSFKSLKFLLTDSKVSRDTKQLVAGVLQKKIQVWGFNLTS
jgi:hypothetical protein